MGERWWPERTRSVRLLEPRDHCVLIAAFVTLAVAVLLGSALAVLHLQTEGSTPPWSLAAPHGLLAIGGLGCLG
jgi:hypothetical protein